MFDSGWMDRIHRQHDQMDDEFRKLLCEPTQKAPKPGDRVVVAAGLVNRGHIWIRKEAEVIELGETSVHVRWPDRYDDSEDTEWIHPVLITDVLGPKGATDDG